MSSLSPFALLSAAVLSLSSCGSGVKAGSVKGAASAGAAASDSSSADTGRIPSADEACTTAKAAARDRDPIAARTAAAAAQAALPRELADSLSAAAAAEGDALVAELNVVLEQDPYLWALVDKTHALSGEYEPADLGPLSDGAYGISKEGMKLRYAALRSLESMAAAAREDGVTLVASSAYRSFAYQRQVYDRIVGELGQAEADRESARPGHSQHQLGLVLDFGSIDDSFAETQASKWLERNAARFGWSLSYPQGLEAVTGYRWESWHYRYLGPDLCALAERRFGGVQQYLLSFLRAWAYPEVS